MAIVRTMKTPVVVLLTVVLVALLTTTVLPKWRGWVVRAHQQPLSSMPKEEDSASQMVEKQVNGGAMWRSRERQIAAAETITPPPSSKHYEEPLQMEMRGNGDKRRNGAEDDGKMERRQMKDQQRTGNLDEIKRLVEEVLTDKKHEDLVDVQGRIEKLPDSSAYKELQDLLNKIDAQPQGLAKNKVQATGITLQMRDRIDKLMRQGDIEIDSTSRPDIREKSRDLRDKEPLRFGKTNRDTNIGSDTVAIDIATIPQAAKSIMTHTTTTTPVSTTSSHGLDLPFIKKGNVEIRPERLPPPKNSSDIYFSLLTAPVYHNLRFSLQYLTWLQTIDPKQVCANSRHV